MSDVLDIHTHNQKASGGEAIFNIIPGEVAIRKNRFYSVGMHPWYISADELQREEQWNKLVSLSKNPNVLALGETGLDKLCETPFELQQEMFCRHIRLSETDARLPLIIHCVHANAELIELRRQSKAEMPWIVHGFRGKKELALEFLNHGFYLSLGEHYQEETLRAIPIDRLFIETDESNTNIRALYEKAALIKEIDVAAFTAAIHENIKNVFFRH
ncbi:MAG: TatD family deoxyribonuclease [Bacteroidales bacterium]|nr:TatD family deoxyribonuclease [Bacteroidales bacterium]